MYKKIIISILFFSFITGVAFAQTTDSSVVQTVDDLQTKIDSHSAQIKRLEEEIKQYNAQATSAANEATSLKNTIKTLDLTKKKITTDIKLTENKINKASLTIEQLAEQIAITEQHIQTNERAIASAFQNIQQADNADFTALLLSDKKISDIWADMDNVLQIQSIVRDKSIELAVLKANMNVKQLSLKGQKTNLLGLKQDLNGKKQAVEFTQQEKATVLAETKNKEGTFVALAKQREAEKAQFEKELYDFESQLHITIDKNSYPAPRFGILSWPLDDIKITQRFGKTVDSVRLYASGTHSGVDFKASIGTPVKAVDDGFVAGTGNTDLDRGCYSFGKWILIQHKNGLSTAYGHLSVISVATGQNIKVGDTIGYSGNTGHTTGPHLHITLYATQGVKVTSFPNSKTCDKALLPIADTKAYLDPLAYFPSL